MESTTRPMSQPTKMRLRGVTPRRSDFTAKYGDTLQKLNRELWHLGAHEYVLEIDMDDRYFRIDGSPRANAVSNSPAVAISFKGDDGPMEFVCGSFLHWHDNVRAIALGLEALRKVDRYGITQAAEQYQGFKAIGSGIAMPAAQMTWEEACRVIEDGASLDPGVISKHRGTGSFLAHVSVAYRRAALKHHPDHGGDAETFYRLTKAKELLEES